MSISFFSATNQIKAEERDIKNQKFRLQIRQKQKQKKFQTIRKQFTSSLKSLGFLQKLKSEKNEFCVGKIRWVLEGLENGLNSPSFYQQITCLQLESYFCEMVLMQELDICQKGRIMWSLTELLYFSNEVPMELINSNLLDYLRQTVNQLNIQNEDNLYFIRNSFEFVQNLTYFNHLQFALFMMESDLLIKFQQLVDSNREDLVLDLRVILLKIYKNLFKVKVNLKFVDKIFRVILMDCRYHIHEQCLKQTLICLKIVAATEGVWGKLHELQSPISTEISKVVMNLGSIIQNRFNAACFSNFVGLLNQLACDENCDVSEQAHLMINEFKEVNFFYKGLKEIDSLEPSKDNLTYINSVLKILSNTTKFKLQQFAYSTKKQQQQFLGMVMRKQIVNHPRFSQNLILILIRMLKQDQASIDFIIDHGIIDVVNDAMNNDYCREKKILLIDLIEQLIQVEQNFKHPSGNKFINLFDSNGVLRDIQTLEDHSNAEISERAEKFLKKLAFYKKEN